MKPTQILLWLSLVMAITSCKERHSTLDVNNFDYSDEEILVRDWEITKPCKLDQHVVSNIDSNLNQRKIPDQGDNIGSFEQLTELYDEVFADSSSFLKSGDFSRLKYSIRDGYLDLDTLLRRKVDLPAFCYAATVINSDIEQDVSMIAGATGGIQIWVNQNPVFSTFTTEQINGYQHNVKVHLTKGDNFVLVKLSHVNGGWKFLMKMAPLKYALENSIGKNFGSFFENHLVSLGCPLQIKLWSPYISVSKRMTLEIKDTAGRVVLKTNVLGERQRSVSLDKLPEGLYSTTVRTDTSVFEHTIFYGERKNYFNSVVTALKPLVRSSKARTNVNVIIDRYKYLDTVSVPHNNAFGRKITESMSRLTDIFGSLKGKNEPFKNIKGLHLRTADSADSRADHYMIYLPVGYNAKKATPLLVMLPHTTGLRRFNVSTYVSDIDRTDHIRRLADRYNFAVLWSSFKVYNQHNLSQSIAKAVFNTVDEVKKDYNIDSTRMYAYGDCAGGAIGLFMTNKYPSYFAAVAVEGPAIPAPRDQEDRYYSKNSRRTFAYDFFDTPENYIHTPILILHSIYDKKASIQYSSMLQEKVNQIGGNIDLRKLYVKKGDNAFYFFINLMPDNNNLTKMFKFYNGKRVATPDKITFSTRELKYNKSFWLTIEDKPVGKKATISAIADLKKCELKITTSNITSLKVDMAALRFQLNKPIKVVVNGNFVGSFLNRKRQVRINLGKKLQEELAKNTSIEGPLNHFFVDPFIVVGGTKGIQKLQQPFDHAVDTLTLNWSLNFLGDTCRVKRDIAITQGDINDYNLIIVGTEKSNYLAQKIITMLPVSISKSKIQMGSTTYHGSDLSFAMIYPNPLNPKRYIILAGSNARKFDSGLIKSIYLDGWQDFVISSQNNVIGGGDFNKVWQ